MAKTDFKSAEEYLATLPKDKRDILQKVRAAIRKAVPGAEEVISYQIPAFRLGKGWIFYYSAWANHYSLACPPPFAAFTAFAKELAPYKSSKSAVNFPLDQPVPEKLIERMSRHQAEQLDAGGANGAASKGAKPRKPAAKKAAKKTAKKAAEKPAKKAAKKK